MLPCIVIGETSLGIASGERRQRFALRGKHSVKFRMEETARYEIVKKRMATKSTGQYVSRAFAVT